LPAARRQFIRSAAREKSMGAQEFEVIVYGASGFTGRLVAEHLLKT
jgi:hypothetical protein